MTTRAVRFVALLVSVALVFAGAWLSLLGDSFALEMLCGVLVLGGFAGILASTLTGGRDL
jgi:hypothetical protein